MNELGYEYVRDQLDSKSLGTGSKEVARKLKKENISKLSKLFKRKKSVSSRGGKRKWRPVKPG